MALNREYFDSLNLEVVKKKYYNANKVEAVLQDIRQQAAAMAAENEQLKAQFEELSGQKAEIGNAVLSAQTVYKTTVARAKAQAQSIIDGATAKRDAIIGDAAAQQDYAVKHVSDCYRKVKEQYEACIDEINNNWQDYLCGLTMDGDCPVPDIGKKVDAIAQELFFFDNEE